MNHPTPWRQFEHSPTPWKREGRLIVSGDLCVATVPATGQRQTPEDEANARHIVRCVNAFPQLIAACEQMAQLQPMLEFTTPTAANLMCISESAKQALAAARGEESDA